MKHRKKAVAKEKRRSAKQSANADPIAPQADQNQENARNEYGILPNRDLKKNLGCG